MKTFILLFLFVAAEAFATPPMATTLFKNRRNQPSATSLFNGDSTDESGAIKPILVVGATGKVGRLVVKSLLEQRRPVLALVRDKTKAAELFGETTTDGSLQIVVADLSDIPKYADTIEQAVSECDYIISVSGSFRLSKPTDFLPNRLFNPDVSSWADKSHPYFANYKAQCFIIDMADKYKIKRLVRLTGLSTGYSAFSFVTMIFSSLLSLTTRYHNMSEQYLRNSSVPHVILRPGGLADEDRDQSNTWLEVDPSGSLPPPARVPRSDVAALAIEVCSPDLGLSGQSYTLGIRAVGDIKPKPQGVKDDGLPTARDCIKKIAADSTAAARWTDDDSDKPYGVAVGIFVYSAFAIITKITLLLLSFLWGLLPISFN